MNQIFINKGVIKVQENVVPGIGPGEILVKVHHSCISTGTELASIDSNSGSILSNLSEKIKKVHELYKNNGLKATYNLINAKLESNIPLGYSAAGEIVEVGSEVKNFKVGDTVACAGSTAYHADYIQVPVNLAVLVPENLGTDKASTVALGAIALQGIRRATPSLGETFVVVGLGFIGQITAQLLKLNGCRVIGVDVDVNRLESLKKSGADFIINPSAETYWEKVNKMTNGFGADGVIITASSKSDELVSEAMKACRRKGRVVLVGDVGLNIKRSDFYAKELDFFISTSYGPGRYDQEYEEKGTDYPIAYVRWTENRNMQEYLSLLADKKISFDNFNIQQSNIEEAETAYNNLSAHNEKPLFVILKYSESLKAATRTIQFKISGPSKNKIRVGLIGSGNFTQATILPVLKKLEDKYDIRSISSKSGTNLLSLSNAYKINTITTEAESIIQDPSIDLVIITTRHNLHAPMILQALKANKHVFVEKPMVINSTELEMLRNFFANNPVNQSLLLTGFNRRFSPFITEIKKRLSDRQTPMVVNYIVNAGYIPTSSWVHDEEGGGRNIGEACHFYDVFNFLTGSLVEKINAVSINPPNSNWRKNDNFSATFKYTEGSVCNLTYTSMGSNKYPKEQMTVFCDGKVIEMSDYKTLFSKGYKKDISIENKQPEKGHFEEFYALGKCLKESLEWPISFADQYNASLMSLEVEELISKS